MMAAKEIPEEYQEAATQRDKVLNNKVVDTSGNPVTLSEWENSLSRTSQGGIKTNSRVNAAAYIEHLKELKGVIEDVALDAAEKLIGRTLDEEAHRTYVKQLLSEGDDS